MVNPEIKFNIHQKCRSCLTEDEEMHHLFTDFDQGLKLSDIVKSTTNFDVDENDALSSYICENCTTIVVEFFNFKAMYLENENNLKSFTKERKVEDLKYERHIENIKEENIKQNTCELEQELQKNLVTLTNSSETEDLEIFGEFVESEAVIKSYNNVEVFNCVQFYCKECNDSYIIKSDFQQHMLAKHNKCIRNVNKYLSTSQVQVPKVDHLKEDENIILQCDTCNEKFKTYVEIAEHYKSHKKYVCEHCGAGFLKKSSLTDHAEIHTSEKRHVCPICGKAFRRRTVLAKHKKIHTHPRQCVCEMCGLRFTEKGTLRTHIKLKHIKERNFHCTICGLWFPLKSTLQKHIERHRDDREREYTCNICQMSYKDKSSLNRHFILKHTENPEKPSCTVCGKEYTTKTNLFKHVRAHHKLLGSELDNCKEGISTY